MKCPRYLCDKKTKVLETRTDDDLRTTWRRRQCCAGHIFWTGETVAIMAKREASYRSLLRSVG